MRNVYVYAMGAFVLAMISSPTHGQLDADSDSLFGSLFGDAPLKDVPPIMLAGDAKTDNSDNQEEVEEEDSPRSKMTFGSPLAKILAIQNEQNEEIDYNEQDEIIRAMGGLYSQQDDDLIDVDRAALNYMEDLSRLMPASVEEMIENLPLSDDDMEKIEGIERMVEGMIGDEIRKDIQEEMMAEAAEFSSSSSSSSSSSPSSDDDDDDDDVVVGLGGGVVDYGQAGSILTGGRRWGRRGGRGGGLGLFRQGQKEEESKRRQQQEEEELAKREAEEEERREQERRRSEAGRSIGGRMRGLRRRKKQPEEEQESARDRQDRSDRPRRVANTIGRARNGVRATADVTRDNVRKAAEFTVENGFKTALGLGEVMGEVNGGLMQVVSNVDLDPINDAATKTAGYLLGLAERNVPGDIVNELLTTSEGNALETVRSVLINSKNPEAMMPIVEQVGGNYVNVINKVKNEMDVFLKVLFRSPEGAETADEV